MASASRVWGRRVAASRACNMLEARMDPMRGEQEARPLDVRIDEEVSRGYQNGQAEAGEL